MMGKGSTIYAMEMPDWDRLHRQMLDEQIQGRGIKDARVLEAMRRVPRHVFVPEPLRDRSYEDRALPIGLEQTISQPYMVAIMLQALAFTGREKVLEIGTGSGYEAALLSHLASQIKTVDIVPELVSESQATFAALGLSNIQAHVGDGSRGWPEEAPFDVIIVAAGAPDVPPALLEQLTPEGKLLIPLGDRKRQILTLFQKKQGQTTRSPLGGCAFVPLRGVFGWPET